MERLAAHFEAPPRTFRAPGRVNLIGEHTDYNDGWVMPAAIDRATWVAAAPRADHCLELTSLTLGQSRTIPLAAVLEPARDWTDYIVGVVWALRGIGIAGGGARLVIDSDIPIGAGLSSSAALTVAAASALLDLNEVRLSPLTIAKLCQQVENAFVGARVGLMDQFAVTHGERGHALELDCRSLAYRPVPLPNEIRLVIANTMVSHAHASGGYNQRRLECESALARLRNRVPELTSLRDVTWSTLEACADLLSDVEYRRVRHVLSENERVRRVADALGRADLTQVGIEMAASHRSLAQDYEVSTPELDLMAAIARRQPGVHGARMTGGGFGGSIVALADGARADQLGQAIAREYEAATGVAGEVLVCVAANAVERVA
jgi:galactokinase